MHKHGITSWTSTSFVRKPERQSAELVHEKDWSYHRLDIRMRNGVKLHKVEFVLGSDVDECALVFGRVAILGGGENLKALDATWRVELHSLPVMHFPLCSTS